MIKLNNFVSDTSLQELTSESLTSTKIVVEDGFKYFIRFDFETDQRDVQIHRTENPGPSVSSSSNKLQAFDTAFEREVIELKLNESNEVDNGPDLFERLKSSPNNIVYFKNKQLLEKVESAAAQQRVKRKRIRWSTTSKNFFPSAHD